MISLRLILVVMTIGLATMLVVSGLVYCLMLTGTIGIPSWTPKSASLLAQRTACPADRDDFLVDDDFDTSAKGFTKSFEFTNKYAGRHAIGLLLGGYTDHMYFSAKNGLPAIKLKLEFSFFLEESLVLSKEIEYFSPFPPWKGHWGGLWLNSYECPENLPIGEPITCQVKVIEPDTALHTTYGPTRFFVMKWDDDPPF